MAMNSFANSFRPKHLDDLVGQLRAKDVIGPWLRQDRIPGAILITGDRSAGKTTLSRVIGRVAVCVAPANGKSCGDCASCKSFDQDQDTHPDYREVNSANDRGIDAVRGMVSRLRNMPIYRKRVVVFDEAHQITDAAQQALLKLVEEPPEHVVLIFATTNPEKLLPTLRSRCSLIPLKPTTVDDCCILMERVTADVGIDKVGITPVFLKKIAVAVGAIPREALKALDQVYAMVLDAQQTGGQATISPDLLKGFIKTAAVSDCESAAEQICRNIYCGQPGAAIVRAEDQRAESGPMLQRMLQVFRQVMLQAMAPKLVDPSYAEILAGLPVFDLKDKTAQKALALSVYKEFNNLFERTSTYQVAVHQVIDASIAQAAFNVQQALAVEGLYPPKKKTAEPKAEEPPAEEPKAETPAPKKAEPKAEATSSGLKGYDPKKPAPVRDLP
jgi:DNA polymerase III subunit gamma/tau